MSKDYVTIECAKLLQRKGYPLQKVYKDNGNRPLFYDLPKEHPDWSQCDAWYYPTLWEAQKWLREKHGIHITMRVILGKDKIIYVAEVYSLKKVGWVCYSEVYENALQIAIETLLDLIEDFSELIKTDEL